MSEIFFKTRKFVSPGDHVIFFLLNKILVVQQKMPYLFYLKKLWLELLHNLTLSFIFVSQAATRNDITHVWIKMFPTGGIAFSLIGYHLVCL